MLFWNLIDGYYFYIIIRFLQSGIKVQCPKCHRESDISIDLTKRKTARYSIRDDMHIDVIFTDLIISFNCEWSYSYKEEINIFDPSIRRISLRLWTSQRTVAILVKSAYYTLLDTIFWKS